jgi:SAM-dependent methyltransferase
VSVDPHAAASWSEDASSYERARPGWPAAAVDWLFERLELGGDATVLDLAAGTGKFTRGLVGRAGTVIAVEPLAGMRAQLARTTPAAEVLDGVAEALPLPPRCVDAVFVAEAFHWFASAATMGEITRVLRTSGGIGLVWNIEDWTNAAFNDRLVAALPEPVSRINLHPTPRATWEVLSRAPAYATPETARFPHEHHLSSDGFADLVGSWSRVASRPAPERAAIHERLLGVAPDGVTLRYNTLAVAARRATVSR